MARGHKTLNRWFDVAGPKFWKTQFAIVLHGKIMTVSMKPEPVTRTILTQ